MISVLILAITGLFGVWSAHRQAESALSQANHLSELTEISRRAQVDFKTQVQLWKNLLLRGQANEQFQNYQDKLSAQQAKVQNDLAEIERIEDLPPGIQTEIGQIKADHAAVNPRGDPVTLPERRQENLGALLDTVHQFATLRHEAAMSAELTGLVDSLNETLHFILLITADAWESQDTADHNNLLQMTGDRGDMMERLRHSAQAAQGSMTENSALFYATTVFERAIWLIRQPVTSFRAC